jgi:hypothetical protein
MDESTLTMWRHRLEEIKAQLPYTARQYSDRENALTVRQLEAELSEIASGLKRRIYPPLAQARSIERRLSELEGRPGPPDVREIEATFVKA